MDWSRTPGASDLPAYRGGSRALEEACVIGGDIAEELRSVRLAAEAALQQLERLSSSLSEPPPS
jgi:hypothetical protein